MADVPRYRHRTCEVGIGTNTAASRRASQRASKTISHEYPNGSHGSDGWSIGGSIPSIPSIPYEGDSITRDAVGRTMHRGVHGEQYAEQYGVERRYVFFVYSEPVWRGIVEVLGKGTSSLQASAARRRIAHGGALLRVVGTHRMTCKPW